MKRVDSDGTLMESRVENRHRTLGWAILAIALFAYAYFQIHIPLGRLHCNDFKHLYAGAKIIAQGRNPYDPELLKYEAWRLGMPSILPYAYLPFTGIVMAPLTLLSFRSAALFWFFLNHVLLFAALYLALRVIRAKITPLNLGLWIFYLALFYPLTRNSTAGQLNVVLLFFFCLIAFFQMRGNAPLVGGLAAFAALFKISPGILFLYFLWTKKWRRLFWAIAFLCAFLIISIFITGIRVHLDFIPILSQMSYGKSTWESEGHDFYRDPFNQSFNSLFHHLFTENPYAVPWARLSPGFANALTALASFVLLFVVLYLFRGKNKKDVIEENALFALFVMLSIFIPSLCWDHYFVQALLPIVVLAGMLELLRGKISCVIFSTCLLILAIPYNFAGAFTRFGAGVLFMSLKLWAGLGIFFSIIALSLFLKKQKERSDGNYESD